MLYLSKKDLYERVERFRRLIGINDSAYPLDIFDLCQNKLSNIAIGKVNFKTNDLRGMAFISNNLQRENHVILVNANKTQAEINYHGTHELMHIAIQNNSGVQAFKCYDKVKPTQDFYTEWQANEGAAEFLVPYKLLLPRLKENYNKLQEDFGTYYFCENCSLLFGVSRVVMQNRLNALSYEIEQYLNGTSLDSIRILSNSQQKREGINTLSLNQLEDIRLMQSIENFK